MLLLAHLNLLPANHSQSAKYLKILWPKVHEVWHWLSFHHDDVVTVPSVAVALPYDIVAIAIAMVTVDGAVSDLAGRRAGG